MKNGLYILTAISKANALTKNQNAASSAFSLPVMGVFDTQGPVVRDMMNCSEVTLFGSVLRSKLLSLLEWLLAFVGLKSNTTLN